jgi:hypothetical protein
LKEGKANSCWLIFGKRLFLVTSGEKRSGEDVRDVTIHHASMPVEKRIA